MEKMTQTYQNLKDYVDEFVNCGGTKIEFQRKIVEKTGISIGTARNYIMLDSKTDNPYILGVLSEMTGIAEEDLFRRHKNDE